MAKRKLQRSHDGPGRPEKPIDWEEVDDLLRAGCLGTEVAARFDMHPSTFYDRVLERYKMNFTQYSSQKKADGESILRQVQYLKAIGASEKGDNTLLIWLGKTRLEQRETQQITVDKASEDNFLFIMKQLGANQETNKVENSADERSVEPEET